MANITKEKNAKLGFFGWTQNPEGKSLVTDPAIQEKLEANSGQDNENSIDPNEINFALR